MAKGKFDMSEFLAPVEGVPESDTMREIAVTDIFDNPMNFYPKPNKGKLGELMDSIRANGMLEPPTVVSAGNGKYRLISGHSRMEAVRALSIYLDRQIADRFQTVMCRVLPSMTPEQEECAVIEANRQRVKSPALLAEEAERLTKIYIKRRETGEELPGRIRDRVAEAMQVNKTKLANLSAIKNGIKVPGIRRAWEEGRLPEAAALEIARMDDDTQYRLLDWVIDNHRTWTINNVREFRVCWNFCKHKCPDTGGFCPNAERMYADRYGYGEWRCGGCCRECLRRDTCSSACCFVVAERPPKEPEPSATRNPAADDPRLKNMTPKFCERVKALREATGLTKKEFAESIGEYPGTYSAWENNSLAGAGYCRLQVRQLAADQRETERGKMKRSGYLQQRDARTQMLLDVMQRTMKQYMLDTLLITMHEDFGWGYDRLSRLAEKWGETYDVYFPAMQSTEESDVYQERLDRATRSYIGNNQFYPFAERYPEIKQLGYGPRRGK